MSKYLPWHSLQPGMDAIGCRSWSGREDEQSVAWPADRSSRDSHRLEGSATAAVVPRLGSMTS